MQIKRNGITVSFTENYEYGNERVTEILENCGGDFTDAGLTVPVRLEAGEAEECGYKLVEGYNGGNWSWERFEAGDYLQNTYHRTYDMVTYGTVEDDVMLSITELLSDTWEATYYSVAVEDGDGVIIDSITGVEADIKDAKFEDILKLLDGIGLELPDEFKTLRIATKDDLFEFLGKTMPDWLLAQGSIKTINLTKKFDNDKAELDAWLTDWYTLQVAKYPKLAWVLNKNTR